MKVNNEIARDIVAEIMSSYVDGLTVDALVSLHEQDGTQGAQIAAECLQRVMPNITPGEHKAIASDVLRYYVDGDDFDYEPLENQPIDYHAQRRRHMF